MDHYIGISNSSEWKTQLCSRTGISSFYHIESVSPVSDFSDRKISHIPRQEGTKYTFLMNYDSVNAKAAVSLMGSQKHPRALVVIGGADVASVETFIQRLQDDGLDIEPAPETYQRIYRNWKQQKGFQSI